MKHLRLYYLVFLVGIVVSGIFLNSCTSAKTINLLQDKNPTYISKPFKDYRLQYNDEIYCTIYSSNKDFSESFNGVISTDGNRASYYTVFANGYISIPYFGDIRVIDMTLREAEDAVQNKMKAAIPDAQVKLALRNNYYYVVSDEKNGKYEVYKDNMTIYQALAINGKPSNKIDLGKVKMVRTDAMGKSIVRTFDLRPESIIESEYYYIKPNDIIYYSTSKSSFFKINSLTSLLSTLSLPVSIVATILATNI